ncbi:carbohydrate porin [Sphingobium sp. H39-3-25]|uniref:carbohydrate porin n=1 Tax=Sphingobium arseniciresistens TaxID=3030834 RepID=UPI0023B9F352|nr:carbohydrate porin [Sphingobium arseniciresistens]
MKGVAVGWPAAMLLGQPLLAPPASARDQAQASSSAATPRPQGEQVRSISLADALAIPGVVPRLDLTVFVQGKVAGEGDATARFVGRTDLFVDVSSDGLGLWEGTVLRTHTELRGSSTHAGRVGGALWPQNTAGVLPLTGQGIEVTSLYLVQKLARETSLILGKINAVDLLAGDPFFGGWGTRRFQNLAFVAPPSGVVPPTIMGAVLAHQAGDVAITAMVFDPQDRSGKYWVDGLLATGVNTSLGATWKGQLGGRETTIGLTATGSTARGIDFEAILGPPGVQTGTRKGSYNIALQFGRDLSGSVKGPSHVGVYAKAAIADGNPNPIKASLIGGFAGHGLLAGRSGDRWSFGIYFYDFSDALQQVASPLTDFDDEAGLEVWYALALGANFDLTFDAQVVDPARGSNDVAVILGARLSGSF